MTFNRLVVFGFFLYLNICISYNGNFFLDAGKILKFDSPVL